MDKLTGLIAYPAEPPEIGTLIKAARNSLGKTSRTQGLETWEESDIPGRFIATEVLEKICDGNILVADITKLNFNVVFEIGYAIGSRKRVYLVRNDALDISTDIFRTIGIFDTLGYETYTSSTELTELIKSIDDVTPVRMTVAEVNRRAPVYYLSPRIKTDTEIRIQSRLKKARLNFRTFDPEEHGRLPAGDAIDGVAESIGVIATLLPALRKDSKPNNYRAAFVAGLAASLNKNLLLLQDGDEPVPIDYRDLVTRIQFPDQIDEAIADFAPSITADLQSEAPAVVKEPETFLEQLTLGASSAENEFDQLGHYFLETEEFHRAVRGEVRVIAGRKGSGKSALFFQARDQLRRNPNRVVLDLKPDGFQLMKFRDRVLTYLDQGAREHTVTAFWEYLLLLEICHKLLDMDENRHMRNNRLYKPYRNMAELYFEDEYVGEGDFSERMLQLTQRVADDFEEFRATNPDSKLLTTGEITEILYEHDVAKLRENVVNYLEFKKGIWILFDNIDKGWPAHGLGAEDVRTVRALIEAMRKLEQQVSREGIECHGMVFIRNDVYELLVSSSSDRGKVSHVALDWTDPDLLREILRRRFTFGDRVEDDVEFEDVWHQICVPHIHGEETSQYMIDRCLMRPRALIEFLRFCRSHAVNLGHSEIAVEDLLEGEENYSNQMLNNLNYEVQDIFGNGSDPLYEFIECPVDMELSEVEKIAGRVVSSDKVEELVELLLWFGFLGILRDEDSATYIYDVKYDMKRMLALARRRKSESRLTLRVNPAFWRALEVKET